MFKQCTQLCIFNIHKFSKNVHNFQRMYIILYVHNSLKNDQNYVYLMSQIFIECTQFCIFNIHIFSKNVQDFVYSTYIKFFICGHFQRMYTILYIQFTKFFKECTLFSIFNIHKFQRW